MEKPGFGSDDGSATCDQKQINPEDFRLLSIQRCAKDIVHACQCRDANCRLPKCQKTKRVVQHAKSCKLKTNGGCRICRQLIALCCYHAKHCQEAKCPVAYCSSVKNKMKHQQLQQQLQQAQILKRRIATMQNRGMSAAVLQTSPGNSNSSNQPSPGAQPHSSPHPPQQGIGMKRSTGPPAGAFQVVRQVLAAAARQTAPPPRMVAASVNYGKELPVMGAISQPHLPSLPILANQQRMAPPNITVQTNTAAPRESELFSPSGSQLSTSLNMTLNQSQYNQPQARQSPLPSISLQQQHFSSITGPVTTIANQSIDNSSVPTTISSISVSQFSSALQQGHPQMTDAFKNRQITKEQKSFVQDGASAKRKKTCTGKMATPETSNKDTTNPPVEIMEMLEEELKCAICTEVLIKPTVINCSHMFCEFCILSWKKLQGRCPICRERIIYETRVLDVHNFIEKVLPPEQKKARQDIVKQREKYAARV